MVEKWGAARLAFCLAFLVLLTSATPAAEPVKAKKLAVFVDSGAQAKAAADLEAALPVELALLPDVELVERAALDRILKEQKLSLSGLADPKSAVKVGQLAGADLLLFVEPRDGKVSVRLVEVNTAKVLLEEPLSVKEDPFLTAVAVRERIAVVLHPDRNVRRLTVGIVDFVNKSGTERSDTLNIELQKALRERLRQETWAIVLERQYPTALLEEKDLARLGLSRGAPDNLPPADIVIMGAVEDVRAELTANRMWEVYVEVRIRIKGVLTELATKCPANRSSIAVEFIVTKLNELLKRQPKESASLAEAEYWRRLGKHLMPGPGRENGNFGVFEGGAGRGEEDTLEAMRAWENLLLFAADDSEAHMNLGICLMLIYGPNVPQANGEHNDIAEAAYLRGTYLIEEALRANPTPEAAGKFYTAVEMRTLISGVERSCRSVRERCVEMCRYILDHQDVFTPTYTPTYADLARKRLAWLNNESSDDPFVRLEIAVRNVKLDPIEAVNRFGQIASAYGDRPEEAIARLAPYCESPIPLVRFEAERTTADLLWEMKKHDSAIAHFDRAIALLEQADMAFREANETSTYVDTVYRNKIERCEAGGRHDEALRTALQGVRYFAKVKEGRIYFECTFVFCYAAEALLKNGDVKSGLDVCRTYFAEIEKCGPPDSLNPLSEMVRVQFELQAKSEGRRLPDWGRLTLVKGTEADGLERHFLAVEGGKLWMVWWSGGGKKPATQRLLVLSPELGKAIPISGFPTTPRAVAAVGDRVFFGGWDGLYEVDANARPLHHYTKQNGQLPSDHISSLCIGAGALYMSFEDMDTQYRGGVAKLDLRTGAVTVLAPTNRDAAYETEPIGSGICLWWDAFNKRLVAGESSRYWYGRESFALTPSGWRISGPVHPADREFVEPLLTWCVVSQGDETLEVRMSSKGTIFEFLNSRRQYEWTQQLPHNTGIPAWDAKRIWVPHYLGLFEIDRQSGKVSLIAYDRSIEAKTAIVMGGNLYVAASTGLYCYPIPK